MLARGELWMLETVVRHDDCAELCLVNGRSGSRILLSPFDVVQSINRERILRVVRARRWQARVLRQACGARAGRLRVCVAHVRLLPYQLLPALAVAAGEPALLLADEVGLGKTIQAGWIIADVLARHHDARILIAVPAGLRHQWHAELAIRFEVESIVADARWSRQTAADLPANVNPWSLPGVYLTSIDFIKRPDVLRALTHLAWDLLVVDEVHTAAAPTDRHTALERLARRSRTIVSISATPFSGDVRSFESIARLGSTSGSSPPLMFRRSREEVGALGSRRHRFVTVRISPAERKLHQLLDRYTQEVWREAPGDVEPVHLAMTVLRKRALSSPYAVLRSLERRLDLLSRIGHVPRQLDLFSDEEAVGDDEPVDALWAPGFADGEREREWLVLLIDAARTATGSDSKLRFLERLSRRIRGESAIVFTEYRDTLMHLAGAFPEAALLHGGLHALERAEVQHGFNVAGGFLLATDAASDGLNLQEKCRMVVNFELPWSPARLEQRIGRVDRIGQRRTVHALTLVARDTAEELVIRNLVLRLRRIAATLGERDRLTAFLTEARIAKIVIGNESSEQLTASLPLKALVRTPDDAGEAADEARRLGFALNSRVSCGPGSSEVLVSSIPPTVGVPEGIVFAVLWSVATSDGVAVHRDLVLIHVNDRMPPGRASAQAVRTAAARALLRFEDEVRRLVARVAHLHMMRATSNHQAIVTRLLAREETLAAFRHDDSPEIQPGLFEHRALIRASDDAAGAQALAEEHGRRITLLERSLMLGDRLDVVGILLIRRDRP